MAAFKYRLIDTAGGEIGIVSLDRASIAEGDTARPGRVSPAIQVSICDVQPFAHRWAVD